MVAGGSTCGGCSVSCEELGEEWPALGTGFEVSSPTQGKDKKRYGRKGTEDTLSEAGTPSGPGKVELDEKKKLKTFRPACDLQQCTVVEFLPAQLCRHCSSEGLGHPLDLGQLKRIGAHGFGASGANDDVDDEIEILADEWSGCVRVTGRCESGLGSVRRTKKVNKAGRQAKEKPCRSKTFLQSAGGKPSKEVHGKQDLSRRSRAKEDRLTDAIAARKANIERRLRVLRLERRGPWPDIVKVQPTKQDQEHPSKKIRTKNAKSAKYELREGDVSCYANSKEEAELLKALALLQHRDLLPEDYDMLLRLDEKVSKRTVEAKRLRSLRTKLLTDADMDSDFAEARCPICMDCYCANQIVKWLPCKHVFHSNCIDMWLGSSGSVCPLDGLEV